MSSRVRATCQSAISPLIETLEARQLLTVTFEYNQWYIEGTDGPDQLILQPKPNDPSTWQAILNGQTFEAPRDSLHYFQIRLGAGDDRLTFKPGEFDPYGIEIWGGDGNDTISGSAHGDWINGEAGNDVLFGRAGDDQLFGGAGDDVLVAGAGSDALSGLVGDDFLAGNSGNDKIQGDSGDDIELGGAGDDLMAGNSGDDLLQGGDGADTLAGGMDADQLKGGDGNDQLDGSFGPDALWGGGGGDTLHGGAAADQISGGLASDSIYHQAKLDHIHADKTDTLHVEDLTSPLHKSDAAKLKSMLIAAAVDRWQYELDNKQANSKAYRYYDRSADGKWFQVDPDTGKPAKNSLLSGCSGGGDYSETNVQEEGVDEDDLVKTDGKYLYLLDDNRLIIMNATPAKDAKIVSTTDIEGSASGLYLNGNFLTVLSGTSRKEGDCPDYYDDVQLADGKTCTAVQNIDQVKVTVFDVSKPGAPAIVEENLLDGWLGTSRIIDGKLYLVLNNRPFSPSPLATWHLDPPLPPDWDGTPNDYGSYIGTPGYTYFGDKKYLQQAAGYLEYESEQAYRKRLSTLAPDALLPMYTSRAKAQKPVTGALLNPTTIYSGPDSGNAYAERTISSIVSLDPTDGKTGIASSTAITGESRGNIYVSRNSLYLASTTRETPMGDWNGEDRTDLYKFSLGEKGINLVASGQAPGTVLDSFSMDEEDGRLRIATTSGSWGQQTNNVVVLEQHGQSLEVEGSITGLAFTEGIKSARFDGDRGYLVTFLQKDPLWVVDFTDPVKPKIAGELEIPGFSSYLHPIADHRLIGVGQVRDENFNNGLQVSLFDVSDKNNPTRPANLLFNTESFDWTESIAQSDHHAFAYFPQQGILAIPVSGYSYDNGYQTSVYILRIGKSDITVIGKVTQDGYAQRNVRIGENLYTISSESVKIVPLTNPQTPLATIPLPPPPPADYGYYNPYP